jgi:two-component system nitrogen regulation sensor histidine kinase NtrY
LTDFSKNTMNFPGRINKRKIFGYFFAGLLLVLSAVILRGFFLRQEKPENVTKNFSGILHQKEKLLSEAIEKMKRVSFQQKGEPGIATEQEFQKLYNKEGILLFVYRNDSLIYWSTNSVISPVRLPQKNISDSIYFEKQKNGWYEVVRIRRSSIIYYGQILIKHQYLFENEYLKNNFEKEFNVPDGTEIKLQSGTNPIRSLNGQFLFCLKIPDEPDLPESKGYILFLLYFTGFILLLVSLYKLYLSLEHRFPSKVIFLLSFILDIILIRLFQFYFHLPHVVYESKLFGPASFSTSLLLPSLGDFLVNSILLLFISYIVFRHYPGFQKTYKRKRIVRLTAAIFLLIIIIAGFLIIVDLIHGLVSDSTIPFNLQDISSLDISSILGCFIISAVFLSYFLISVRLFQSVSILTGRTNNSKIKIRGITETSLSRIVLCLIFFSITGTLLLNHFNDSNEKEKRKLLALKLGTTRDALAEVLFSKMEPQILGDSLLSNTAQIQMPKKPKTASSAT